MASSWGISWGFSWGNSWGLVGDAPEPPEPPEPPVAIGFSTVVTGLEHLEDEEVVAWGMGLDLGAYIVRDAQITVISQVPVTSCIVGLGYDADFKSSKLAYVSDLGQPLGQRTRVDHVGFIFINTHAQGVRYGHSLEELDDLPAYENEEAVDPNHVWPDYDKDVTEFNGGWDTDSRICLKASAPRPVTICAVPMVMSKNDKA